MSQSRLTEATPIQSNPEWVDDLEVVLDACEEQRPNCNQLLRQFISDLAKAVQTQPPPGYAFRDLFAGSVSGATAQDMPARLRQRAYEQAEAIWMQDPQELDAIALNFSRLKGLGTTLTTLAKLPGRRVQRNEVGPSGYTTAFTRPDPLDPNDRMRQKTQARAADFPYDTPVTYGRPLAVGDGQDSYPTEPVTAPPVPRGGRPKTKNVWDLAREALDPYEPGPQAPDASYFNYGKNGRLGDGMDPLEMELDVLRQDFRDTFLGTLPVALSLPKRDLFSLLVDLDPEYAADLFAPEDDSEMQDTYSDWGHRVFAPGAEEDPE